MQITISTNCETSQNNGEGYYYYETPDSRMYRGLDAAPKRVQEAVAMLDAVRDEDGEAYLKGVGDSMWMYDDLVVYWIAKEFS